MNTIVFHGVPQGHDVFGGGGDKYFESFYGISESFKGAKTVFVVEVRKDASGFCSYYSYIRPQNVVAYSGRSGSYFGMSLKVDSQYCTDVYSLFQLFDKIYEEKIIGSILQQSGNTEQYRIASFVDADYQLKSIAQLADNQIKAYFENDFEEIDSSFTKQYASASVYYNPDDVNSEAFFNSTRLYGKVFISPEYASKDSVISTLSSSEKKHQSIKVDYEKQIADLQKENAQIPDLKGQLSKIQTDYENLVKQSQEIQITAKSLKSSNSALEQKLKETQQELEQIKKATNIGQVADRLEPSLNELLGIMRSIKPSPETRTQQSSRLTEEGTHQGHRHSSHGHHHGKHSVILRYLPLALGALLLILLSFLLLRGIKSGPRIKSLQQEKVVLEKQLDSLKRENARLLTSNSSSIVQQEGYFRVISRNDKYPNALFEVSDASGVPVSGPLHLKGIYSVVCRGVDQEGEWKSDGFSLMDDKKKNPIKVQVNKVDKAVLSFYIKNDKALSYEYQVN